MFEWLDYFHKGGVIMYPILLCSILALAIAFERALYLRDKVLLPSGFINEIKDLVYQRNIKQALRLCQDTPKPLARIIEAGILKHEYSREVIKETFENAGKNESPNLERFLHVLATIASVSPLLGLLGTVVGMIRVFEVISTQGVGDAGALAGGISEALLTTAAGLLVAIPTVIIHNYFQKKANNLMLSMESITQEILDIIAPEHKE